MFLIVYVLKLLLLLVLISFSVLGEKDTLSIEVASFDPWASVEATEKEVNSDCSFIWEEIQNDKSKKT
jgi:hypothetical protein